MTQPDTRQKILTATLTLFLDKGYDSVSIADIRAASGATTGSIYHFFGSKAGIALALWDDAIAGWNSSGVADGEDEKPRDMIMASVAGLLRWGRDHPHHFRVYDELVWRAARSPEFAEIRKRIEDGQAESAKLYARWVSENVVRDLPFPLARSLMLGPALEALRSGVALNDETITLMARNAWQAVRAPKRG